MACPHVSGKQKKSEEENQAFWRIDYLFSSGHIQGHMRRAWKDVLSNLSNSTAMIYGSVRPWEEGI